MQHMKSKRKPDASKPGPLESYKIAGHCEMCGANSLDGRHRALTPRPLALEPAFNPSGEPMTLCYDCRIGSAELLADQRAAMLTVLESAAARWDKYDEQDAPELGAAIQAAIDKTKAR